MLLSNELERNDNEKTDRKIAVKNSQLCKFLMKVFVVSFCILPIYRVSGLLLGGIPDVKYSIFTVDLFGFNPSLLAVSLALYIYLGNNKTRRFKIFKIILFTIFTCILTLLFLPYVYIGHALNFDLPMLFLLIIFTCLYEIAYRQLVPEKWKTWLTLIQNENDLKEIFVVVFSLVGFPLLFLDTLPALIFGTGVVGGAGLRDGLNMMLLTLFLYVLMLYGTMKLTNKIVK